MGEWVKVIWTKLVTKQHFQNIINEMLEYFFFN